MTAHDEDFTVFARAQAAALRRTAYLLCGDWHTAEDIAQSALIRLYVAWGRVSRAQSPQAYARSVVVRVFLDQQRRFWRREIATAQLPDHPWVGPGPEAGPEDGLVLRAALARVPPRQRAMIVLRHWEDLSVAETALALRCSQGNVKSQTARGLATLREALEQAGYRPPSAPVPVPDDGQGRQTR